MDRQEDVLRSGLRAVEAVSCIPGAATGEAWCSFMEEEVMGPPPMHARYQTVKEERQESNGGAFDGQQ